MTNGPTVTVRGEAQLESGPDLATISATVHSAGSGADGVRSELARASAQVRALLNDHAGVIARFHTSGLHVAPVFAGRSGTKITGYRGSFSTSIEIADFAALSDLVYALATLPNCQIDGPRWTLRPDSPLFRDVRRAAVIDGRRRAADYAAAVQMTVGELLEISDTEGGGIAYPQRFARAMAMDAAESQPSFDFEPATLTVTGQVTLRFALVLRRAGAGS